MRRQISSPRACMLTEYQASYLPPSCYKSVTTTYKQKNPYHPLKGTSADISTVRTSYAFQNWMKTSPKVSKPSGRAEDIRAPNAAVNNTHYTTVYRGDFRAWNTEKRQPYRMKENLKVKPGFSSTDNTPKEEPKYVAGNNKSFQTKREHKPFEGMSSYRLDYVPHQVQPKQKKWTSPYQSNKKPPAESSRPKPTQTQNQDLVSGASDFFNQFQSWSLESNPAAEHKCQTPHAETATPKCHVTKSVTYSMQGSDQTMKPFQVMVNMKECCSAWDGTHCFTRS